MDTLDARLRAVCDISVPSARENAGRHEYDGTVQDLSPTGVRDALARLGSGDPLEDPHEEAHLAAAEEALRVELGELELHRRHPLVHLSNLDLASYDREYAPAEEREAARRSHVEAWPDAVAMALESLDEVSAPVAGALLGAARGLAEGLPEGDDDTLGRAREAHGRLVAHLEEAARTGDPDPSLGGNALARLMGTAEATTVDLDVLAATATQERDRLTAMLHDACARLDPAREPAQLVADLLRDHPDIDGVLDEARQQTEEVLAFSRERSLAPHLDGECLVGPAPKSRSWAMAMMSWAAPAEADAPSWYHVTPPDPSWPAEEIEEWLSVFSRTTLPGITAHEVAPGHYAHGRSLRRGATPIRRTVMSMTFAEGWAHYVEEVMVEEGFRGEDPRFAIGVALEALIRVTRLSSAIGLHTGAITVDDATEMFVRDALMNRAGAASEARRGTFDPTYGRYTWGKLAILDTRERARLAWGEGFSLQRLHAALLDLGSPPIGLLDTAVHRG